MSRVLRDTSTPEKRAYWDRADEWMEEQMKTLRLTVTKGRECYYLTQPDGERKVCGSFPALCLAIVALLRAEWKL